MTGPNAFPVIQRLFNSCRRAGVWARIVLETENGRETLTFSTVSRPSNLPEEKDSRGRKKPSKARKDRERREAWLERKRMAAEKEAAGFAGGSWFKI